METDVSRNVAKGFFWLFLSSAATSVLLFFFNIIVIRIVNAEAFGIMAICTTLISFLSVISSFGISEALINRKENFEKAKKAGFSAFFIASTFVSIAVILLAPQLALFFNDSRIATVLQITIAGFWIKSLSAVPLAVLTKDFAFKKIAFFELLSSISNPLAVIAVFFILPKQAIFLSLPLGYLASSAIFSALVIKNSRFPEWKINLPETKKLASFGLRIMVSDLLSALLLYGMNLVIGKVFSLTELGIFAIAFTITNAPVEMISGALGRASYSGFSKLKNKKKETEKLFLHVSEKTLLLLFPVIAWFFVFAGPFNDFILKKDPSLSTVIIIFCAFAFFRTLQKNYTTLFAGSGKPGLNVTVTLTEIIALIAATLLLVPWIGFIGAVIALAIARFFSMATALILSKKVFANFRGTNYKILKIVLSLVVVPAAFFLINSFVELSLFTFLLFSFLFFLLFLFQYWRFGSIGKMFA